MQTLLWQQTFLRRQVRAVTISWDKVRIFAFRGIETLLAFICKKRSMLTRLGNRRVLVRRLWMLSVVKRRLILCLILVHWRMRSGRDARRQLQERDLRATLPLARTTTTRVLSLQQHSTATTKTPDASPLRKRFFTRRRQSSTPTGPESTNNHPRCPTRTDSFPRSSRSRTLPRPT